MVEIAKDRWGISHVSAPDRRAAFAAQGWVAADDRIWQMEWDRRRALGRWAEVAGQAAVREDAFFRRIGLASAAHSDWEALSASAKSMTQAYSEGVNRWLEQHVDRLPPEFEFHPEAPQPWEPWHCVAVYKVRHVFMGTLYRKLWRGAVTLVAGPDAALAMRGDPGSSAASPIIEGYGPKIDLLEGAAEVLATAAADLAAIDDVDGGSNSWAVHGSRTKSGLPLLAGDPHRGIEFPNVYHQTHIRCPDFDVIGLGFPGVPGLAHFGHNNSVAWCITHGMADDTDVFVEPTSGLSNRRAESIEVFDAPTVAVELADTRSGPVILGDLDADVVLAAMWTGIWGRDSTFECLEPMLLARNCDELEAAVTDWVIPVNSLLTADVEANISFRVRGRLVSRPVSNRWTPVAGSGATRWKPADEVNDGNLQRSRNPDRGFLVTANNRISDDGPYISLDFAGPARHDRIVRLLEQTTDATVDDMLAIHRDVYSSVAARVCAVVQRAVTRTELGSRALSVLAGWDHEMAGDSAAAAVYGACRRKWTEYVAEQLSVGDVSMGERGWPRDVDSCRMLHDAAATMLLGGTWTLIPGLEGKGGPDDTRVLDRTFGELVDVAVAEVASALGPDVSTWRWDVLHTMVSPHPLASARGEAAALSPPVHGFPGDGDTVRCGSVSPRFGERGYAGSVARYVFDVDDWDASGWVVPHGVSGVRGSGHDLDQRAAWLSGDVVPMVYSSAAVAGAKAESRTVEL